MKKIIMVLGVILLLNATFAAIPKATTKKKECVEALYSLTDNCNQTLSTTVTCCGSCDPSPGGNMYQAGLDWANPHYYMDPNGCLQPR